MTDLLVQLAVSGLLTSAALAIVAYAVHRYGRYPVLAHLLWVLVLAKLVTPPLLAIPFVRLPSSGSLATELLGQSPAATAVVSQASADSIASAVVNGLILVWVVGSVVVLAISLVRIWSFDRSLRRSSVAAPGWVAYMAQDAARALGMRSAPAISISRARLSPMTWWTGGRVRIVLPEGLIAEMESQHLAWILAHELAHVKRRDYMVRWLEWLAVVTFWWNPVAWWARSNLRLDEEASCDALVIEHLGAGPKSYARALLAVVEHLARPALRPPAVATGIDGGGSLERRFRLIITGHDVRRAPRLLVGGLVGASLLAMPLSFGAANEPSPSAMRAASIPSADAISEAERAFLGLDGRSSGVPVRAQGQAPVELDPPTATVSAKVKVGAARKAENRKATKSRRAKQAAARKAAARKAARIAARQARQERLIEVLPSPLPENDTESTPRGIVHS